MLNVVDCATHTYWFGDVDAGKMFLNYPLDIRMRKNCGLDISCMSVDGSRRWDATFSLGDYTPSHVDDGGSIGRWTVLFYI